VSDKRVSVGQRWRRKKDGTVVRIEAVRAWYTEFDVYWRSEEGRRRGAIWQFNFLNNYERVEDREESA
jgi:hypothetical protein